MNKDSIRKNHWHATKKICMAPNFRGENTQFAKLKQKLYILIKSHERQVFF